MRAVLAKWTIKKFLDEIFRDLVDGESAALAAHLAESGRLEEVEVSSRAVRLIHRTAKEGKLGDDARERADVIDEAGSPLPIE